MTKTELPLKVVLPLVLGIVAAVAIAINAELGYRRLEVANREMALAVGMQAGVHEMLALIVDAETGQRGYLLTGNEEYLAPYNAALPKFLPAFSNLREMLTEKGTVEQRDAVGRINNLSGKRLAELEAAIALYRKEGPQAAQTLLDTGIGKRTMDEIRAETVGLLAAQRDRVDAATSRWANDVRFARIGMEVVTVLTVSLFLIVLLLLRRDALQREARRRATVQETEHLEAMVQERTEALSELSNHLQGVREDEKAKLARDIHDELGGILVSAKMDVAWAANRVKAKDPEAAVKLERAQQALDSGVDIKRRIIEELRPTLLDNLGLSAAIDWQVHEICDRAGLKCAIVTPTDDSSIAPNVSIALYRILQEALTNIVKYARAKNVAVDLGVTHDSISLLIEDDGIGIPDGAQHNLLSHGITGMRQRVRALHGEFSIGQGVNGGTVIEIDIPVVAKPAPAEASVPEIRVRDELPE